MLDAAVAHRLKLVGFDVDGVLTDNGIYVGMVGDHPVEFKRFHIQDGLGVRLLRTAGLLVVWLSGRESTATMLRARELAVDEVIQDPTARKLPVFEALLERRGLAWEECAFVGDDLADLPLLTRVGLPIAVANGVTEVKAAARVVTTVPGGHAAVRVVEKATGRLIVSGVGKSGLIARKIAATLTSTGSPASFLHPVDSLHGDLGLVGREDVAILLSKSGASDELFGLVGQLKRLGVPIIALTGDPDSLLARQSDVVLDASVTEEACPETLAPTTSTTAALALGDALAVTLLEVKGFRREQFAALHPGGTLGRHLLLRVADVMLAGNVPALGPDCPMRECVVLLAEKRGTVAVVDAAGSLVGVVTAGDLTRLMERTDQFLDIPVRDVMTRTPKSTTADELAGAAVRLMEQHGIMALPVLDGGRRVVGMVHLHDLMKAGATGPRRLRAPSFCATYAWVASWPGPATPA